MPTRLAKITAAVLIGGGFLWHATSAAERNEMTALQCNSCTVYRNTTSAWTKVAKLPYAKVADNEATGWVYLAPDSSIISNDDNSTPSAYWGVLGGGAGKAMAIKPDGGFGMSCDIKAGEFESLIFSVGEIDWDNAGNITVLKQHEADPHVVADYRDKTPPNNFEYVAMKYDGTPDGVTVPVTNQNQFSAVDDGRYSPIWDLGTIPLLVPPEIKPTLLVAFEANGKSYRYGISMRYDRCLFARQMP